MYTIKFLKSLPHPRDLPGLREHVHVHLCVRSASFQWLVNERQLGRARGRRSNASSCQSQDFKCLMFISACMLTEVLAQLLWLLCVCVSVINEKH